MFAPVRCCFDVMFLLFALLFALTVVGLSNRSSVFRITPTSGAEGLPNTWGEAANISDTT